ncbi:hypothetical protein [Ferroacidibacillus organovorans]|uniref:Peptidase A2 domain-containing protein n=1 Tax=Ferroacidibacillus organovorans TaxID=1765683 RepID=A0A1V4ERY8_9BACL|nr:hypothetical protein [Ferroacidibacillus organovorans]OPG15398.1 hypothetical protein B2M26_11965 [Ferroacidibacillus organovorans]
MPTLTRLPAEFIGHRIVVKPFFDDGVSLALFTDTGGSMLIKPNVLHKATKIISKSTEESFLTSDEDREELQQAFFPAFNAEAWIPGIDGNPGLWFIVYDDTHGLLKEVDGMIGQQWFADRVWTIDYLKEEFHLGCTRDDLSNGQSCPLDFKTDEEGKRLVSFPRIQAKVDGETIDFLFDTGATVVLSDKVYNLIGDGGPQTRGTSFITASVFERWKCNHPDWLTCDDADELLNESMIQVSEVEIAGYKVGPVWFTRRADTNFHDYMSSFMDKKIEGAIGGSLFQYFSIVVDYSNAVAYFCR